MTFTMLNVIHSPPHHECLKCFMSTPGLVCFPFSTAKSGSGRVFAKGLLCRSSSLNCPQNIVELHCIFFFSLMHLPSIRIVLYFLWMCCHPSFSHCWMETSIHYSCPFKSRCKIANRSAKGRTGRRQLGR